MGRTPAIQCGLLVALCLASFVPGCAGRGTDAVDPDAGLVLEYSMPEGRALTYEMTNSFKQTMEVREQSFDTVTTSKLVFAAEPKGEKAGGYAVGITVKSMEVSIASPQGDLAPDTGSVEGRAFEMTVSRLGEEGDLEGAAAVVYSMGPVGERGLKTEFSNVFPDVPGRPVAVGDSWTTSSTITEDTGRASVRITTENLNTLAGFETVGGRECARIEVEFTGTLEGEGDEQGVHWTTTGDLVGSGTMYFAHEEGIFVSESTSGMGEGVITGGGEQEIIIPIIREFALETKLVE